MKLKLMFSIMPLLALPSRGLGLQDKLEFPKRGAVGGGVAVQARPGAERLGLDRSQSSKSQKAQKWKRTAADPAKNHCTLHRHEALPSRPGRPTSNRRARSLLMTLSFLDQTIRVQINPSRSQGSYRVQS